MRKMSKIMVFFLAAVMFAVCCFTAYAQDSMTVSAENTNAKAGEQVTVTVNLENNTGMNYLKVQISYDDSVMTLSSVKNGKLFDNLASMPGNTSANPFTMVYAGAGDENYSGKLFTLTFDVSDKAVSGNYDIGVTVAQCTNQSNENVSVSASGAVIAVEGETTIVPPETETKEPETTYKNYSLGDVDANGKITSADARLILRCSAKLEVFYGEQLAAADLDSNGKVTSADARIDLRISAKLETIDKYLNGGSDNTVSKELSAYIGKTSADIESAYGVKFSEYEGLSTWLVSDICDILIDETDNEIYNIDLFKDNGYTVWGVNVGASRAQAVAALEKAGYAPVTTDTDDLWVFDYAKGICADIILDSDVVTEISISENDVDASDYIGFEMEFMLLNFPDLVLVEENEEFTLYSNDKISVRANADGFVYYVSVDTECAITACGVKVGMIHKDADSILAEQGFDYEPEGRYFGDYMDVSLNFDLSTYIVNRVSVHVDPDSFYDDEDGFNYDLSSYICFELWNIGDYVELTNDDDNCWYNDDNSLMVFAPNGVIEGVCILGECEFNILGIEYGTDKDEALSRLEEYGFEMSSDTCGESFWDEYIFLEYEYGKVCYIDYGYTEYNYKVDVADCIGWHYEDVIDGFGPLTADEDGTYFWYEDSVGFVFDDEDYVWEIMLNGTTAYTVFGVECGMDVYDAVEILEAVGFEAYSDDIEENGSMLFFNYDDEISVMMVVEDSCVLVISLIID